VPVVVLPTGRRGRSRSDEAERPKGSVMTVAFELDGQAFTALNGGPLFKFTEAISLVVNCDTQMKKLHVDALKKAYDGQ
jgi:predicted 3-demethylubiquinone-9 3-methyltransferase (glyoxalase superfamily)